MKKSALGLFVGLVFTMGSTVANADPVEFKVLSDWGSGYNAQLKLTNEGTESLTDWRIKFDYEGDIKYLYSGNLITGQDGHFVIEGKSWNKTLKPGQTIYLGWSGKKSAESLENVEFAGSDIDAPEGPYLINYDLQADWGTGYVASIGVTNNSEDAMNDWKLSFDYPYEISSIYNARIVSHTEGRYVIEGVDEGADLTANEVTVFVIRGGEGDITEKPSNIEFVYE